MKNFLTTLISTRATPDNMAGHALDSPGLEHMWHIQGPRAKCRMESYDGVGSNCVCSRADSMTSLFCEMILVCAIVSRSKHVNT